MSGEFDAAGSLANAGLAAGAIEGREPFKAGEGVCLNCGAQVGGRFCANCGQASHVHRTLWHLVEEVLHGIFHFDTKAWRTLPLLVGRPGTLTRSYIYGKRARYVSPLATFLLCVFFMFFAFSLLPSPNDINLGDTNVSIGDTTEAVNDLAEAQRDLAAAQREQLHAIAHPDPDMPAGLEARLAQQAVTLAQVEVTRRQQALARTAAAEHARVATTTTRNGSVTTTVTAGPTTATTPVRTSITTTGATTATTPATGTATTAVTTPPATPGVTPPQTPHRAQTWQEELSEKMRAPGAVHLSGVSPEFNERIRQKLLNPDLTIYKLVDEAYKYSFLLVPISLPFLMFLFLWKRGITLYDHTVFAFYALSFASLLCIAVIGAWQYEPIRIISALLTCIGLPVHTYFHLKGAYALGWWSALWRTVFLLFFALIALVIYLVAILVSGLAG